MIKNVKCPILFEFRVLSKTFWTRTIGFRTTKIFSYSKLVRTQHNTTHNGGEGYSSATLGGKKDCYEVSEKEILSPVVEFPT